MIGCTNLLLPHEESITQSEFEFKLPDYKSFSFSSLKKTRNVPAGSVTPSYIAWRKRYFSQLLQGQYTDTDKCTLTQ